MENTTGVVASLDSVGGSVGKRRTAMVGRDGLIHDHTPATSQSCPPIGMNRQLAFAYGSTTIVVGLCRVGGA